MINKKCTVSFDLITGMAITKLGQIVVVIEAFSIKRLLGCLVLNRTQCTQNTCLKVNEYIYSLVRICTFQGSKKSSEICPLWENQSIWAGTPCHFGAQRIAFAASEVI